MSDKSSIEWTDATWNPTVGCSIVSPGCTNCYAMKVANGLERRFDSPKYRGLTNVVNGNAVWTGEVRLDEAALLQPLKWKKARKIFVNSMSDLFHESLSDADIDRVFAVMALCPQHTFQVLTKRAERMRAYFADDATHTHIATIAMQNVPVGRDITDVGLVWAPHQMPNNYFQRWPLRNVWLGVSCERQQEANERIPLLEKTPAAMKFLSLEPLLGPVDLTRCGSHYTGSGPLHLWRGGDSRQWRKQFMHPAPEVQWVIVGGESGSRARPMHPQWARDVRDQCAAAGVPFFFKQWGEHAPRWPGDRSDGMEMERVGKHRAGRLLDGREHNAFPVTEGSVTKLALASHDANQKEAAHS